MENESSFHNGSCIILALFQLFMYKVQSFKLETVRHFRNENSNQRVLLLIGTAPQTLPLPTRDIGGGAEVNSLCTL